MQTYEEFRAQVDRDLGIPPENYKPEAPKTEIITPKPQGQNNPNTK